jgi:penicillin-insensitive murein DD-endopeptidase
VRILSIGILSALFAFAGPDRAAPAPRGPNTPAAPALSIGSPNEGRLDGGAHLAETPYLRVVPYYAESNARWGLPSLVGLLDRAAKRVAKKFPDAVLSVGDLSRKAGGELDRHHSHESGRDADVGFYIRNAKRPILPAKFVAFSAAGTAPSMPGALFDEARNWAFIEALIDDPVARVSQIFVVAHIRARLLRYAEQTGVSRELRERAAEVMMQPRRAAHDDHFHVRVACPREQHTCVEQAVVYSPRVRPPVVRARHRSGTDDRQKLLPALPASPKGGGVATLDDPSDFPIADAIEKARTIRRPAEGGAELHDDRRTSELGRPLANAADADNVDR